MIKIIDIDFNLIYRLYMTSQGSLRADSRRLDLKGGFEISDIVVWSCLVCSVAVCSMGVAKGVSSCPKTSTVDRDNTRVS